MLLKLKLLIILMLAGLLVDAQDIKASKEYKKKLQLVKDVISRTPDLNVVPVSSAIDFFEEITGITSQSDGNYFGRFSPTNRDYEMWSEWYDKNNVRLYWDKKQKKVKVKLLTQTP